MILLPEFRQGAEPWASRRIGTYNGQVMTLANGGCFITTMCMIAWNSAIQLDPGQFLDRLEDENALLDDGTMTYDGLMRAFPRLLFHERVYTTNDVGNFQKMTVDSALQRIRRLIRLGQPVGITVDAVGNDRRYDHIVAAYDNTPDGDFLIIDPAYGYKTKFSERYGRPETGVMGYVSIIGQSLQYPDDGDPKAGQALTKMAEIRRKVEALPSSQTKTDLRFLTRDAIDLFINPT